MSSEQQAELWYPRVFYLLMPAFQVFVMDGVNIPHFCGLLESVASWVGKHWDKSYDTRDKLNHLAHSDFPWPAPWKVLHELISFWGWGSRAEWWVQH